MNRYVARGLLDDARNGAEVVYVGNNLVEARRAFKMIASRAGWDFRVSRARGRESLVSLAGRGRIRFVSLKSLGRIRGTCVDILYLDADPDQDHLRAIMPCLATSPNGELIRR